MWSAAAPLLFFLLDIENSKIYRVISHPPPSGTDLQECHEHLGIRWRP